MKHLIAPPGQMEQALWRTPLTEAWQAAGMLMGTGLLGTVLEQRAYPQRVHVQNHHFLYILRTSAM